MTARQITPEMMEATARHHEKARKYLAAAGNYDAAQKANESALAAYESARKMREVPA